MTSYTQKKTNLTDQYDCAQWMRVGVYLNISSELNFYPKCDFFRNTSKSISYL